MNTEVVKNTKALPGKIENRLMELKEMKEFNEMEIDYCRRTYWDERDEWHQILIRYHNRALARQAA